MDNTELTLKQASDAIRAKKVSPVELTEACLARMKTYNPKTNAWITMMHEQAMAQAKVLEKEQAAGKLRGPLHGIPIGLKDNIDTAGTRTTAGSKTLAGNVPTEDAEATRRLLEAGAIIVGKANMHIFAAGATSAVSYFGPVRNPWNLADIAGGSSGGSAAAVANENCFAALGTDTGGSIRTPSAMCGTTPEATLKPRLMLVKRLPAKARGTAIAAVIHIMPTIVPAPKINRYTVAHNGLWMVDRTSSATAADPARPCTIPITSGRTH